MSEMITSLISGRSARMRAKSIWCTEKRAALLELDLKTVAERGWSAVSSASSPKASPAPRTLIHRLVAVRSARDRRPVRLPDWGS